MTIGLAFVSVAGTTGANLLGGWIYDYAGGADSVIVLSMAAAVANLALYLLWGRRELLPKQA